MLVNSIDPSFYLNQQQTSRTSGSSLGKDEFLKILMAQLKNQDPMNPMKDREFIQQMTSFSSLEQMMNMSSAIDNMVQSQSVAPVVKYSAMIGKEVAYNIHSEDTGKIIDSSQGQVSAVTLKDGEVLLELKNGEKISINSIIRVSEKVVD